MLTKSQLKQLQEALLSAFPSADELRMMVRLELDANLDAVAGGDNLSVVVFKLVMWAESGGRIATLIAGAESQQPGNLKVKRLVQDARAWDAAQPAVSPHGAPAQAVAPAEIDIFLSYSHHDDALMRPLHAGLRGGGFSVWIDEGLEPGTPSWQAAIQEAIRQARCLVLLMTPHANASTWVNNEVHYASALGKRIFPVHGAGSETEAVPLLLFGAQRVDIRREPAQAIAQKLLPALQRALRPDASAAHAPPPTPKPPPVTFDWVEIPAGPFLMGSDKQKDPQAFDDELPQHTITLPAYRIARVPVTVAQFAVFVAATGHKTEAETRGSAWVWTGKGYDDVKGASWQHPRGPKSDVRQKQDHPVTCVTFRDAVAFCAWASEVTGATIRLPTEAEWEKAARGTDGRLYPWGDEKPTQDLCNFNMNVGDTTPVGSYPKGASPYGVLDMSGNVWEWTSSLWKGYPYDPADGREDAHDEGSRIVRGGSFFNHDGFVRCACRDGDVDPSDDVGLRVASPGF